MLQLKKQHEALMFILAEINFDIWEKKFQR